jgi:predicted HicB family RNase H-like nuclease
MGDYLEHKGYFATVGYSASDKVFYGKIEGINDLVNFEADNVKDLEKEFKEAVDDYLATCKEIGKKPDKTYKGVFNVRVTSELHKKVATIALRKDLKLNYVVKRSLDFLVENEDKVLSQ